MGPKINDDCFITKLFEKLASPLRVSYHSGTHHSFCNEPQAKRFRGAGVNVSFDLAGDSILPFRVFSLNQNDAGPFLACKTN